jgi:hypothetical protein
MSRTSNAERAAKLGSDVSARYAANLVKGQSPDVAFFNALSPDVAASPVAASPALIGTALTTFQSLVAAGIDPAVALSAVTHVPATTGVPAVPVNPALAVARRVTFVVADHVTAKGAGKLGAIIRPVLAPEDAAGYTCYAGQGGTYVTPRKS